MPRHRRHGGRHRTVVPPSNATPAVLASAVIGATVAALSTAGSGGGFGATAATVMLHGAAADTTLEHIEPQSLPGEIEAETPMRDRTALATAAARQRVSTIAATRATRARQVALVEARRPKWVLPLPGGSYRITSLFGSRWGVLHGGLDMAAPAGTPVYAAGDGVVLEPIGTTGFGNVVVIGHASGEVTLYGHNSTVLVRPGERVRAGQMVALVGSSGVSTGNHLHFEVRAAGQRSPAVDTTTWLAGHGVAV